MRLPWVSQRAPYPRATMRPMGRRCPPRPGLHSSLKAEHVQDRRRRAVLELGRVLQDEERLFRAHQHGDVLLAVDRVADGRGIDARTDIIAPYLLQGLGVVRCQRAVGMSDEDQVAGRRERSTAVRILEPQIDLGLPRGRVDRLEAAVETFALLETAAREALARFDRSPLVDEILLLDRAEGIAPLERWNVQQIELGIVGAGLPVLAAKVRWTETLAGRLGARAVASRAVFLDIHVGIVVERSTGLGIEPGCPVQLIDILLAEDE